LYNTYQIQQKTRQNREKHKRYGQTEQGVIVAELCSQSLYIRTWLLLTRAGGNLGAKYRCTEKRFRYKLPKFPKIGENKRLFRRFAGLPPSTPNQTANPDFEWTTLHQQTTLQRGKAGVFRETVFTRESCNYVFCTVCNGYFTEVSVFYRNA